MKERRNDEVESFYFVLFYFLIFNFSFKD